MNGDPLAYTVLQHSAQFVVNHELVCATSLRRADPVRLQAFAVNSAVFTRWTIERQKSLDEGGDGRPTLTSMDWARESGVAGFGDTVRRELTPRLFADLQKAIDAAQKMMFAVSVESTLDGSPLRSCIWPEAVVGGRPPLRLDPKTVEDYRTALDTTTCIVSTSFWLVSSRCANLPCSRRASSRLLFFSSG